MRSALVLNASYEPLSVVSARRAACLVLAEKADVIEKDGTALHSPSLTLPSPLVIRLPRAPGAREARWAHLLCGPVDTSAMPVASDSGDFVATSELAALKAQQAALMMLDANPPRRLPKGKGPQRRREDRVDMGTSPGVAAAAPRVD